MGRILNSYALSPSYDQIRRCIRRRSNVCFYHGLGIHGNGIHGKFLRMYHVLGPVLLSSGNTMPCAAYQRQRQCTLYIDCILGLQCPAAGTLATDVARPTMYCQKYLCVLCF